MAGQFGVEFTITVETGVSPLPGMHLCFRAPNRASVGEFHAAALTAGGHDDGGPGLRPQYHPDYYAAFVVDPDGHRIEAVCHAPEKAMKVSRWCQCSFGRGIYELLPVQLARWKPSSFAG